MGLSYKSKAEYLPIAHWRLRKDALPPPHPYTLRVLFVLYTLRLFSHPSSRKKCSAVLPEAPSRTFTVHMPNVSLGAWSRLRLKVPPAAP